MPDTDAEALPLLWETMALPIHFCRSKPDRRRQPIKLTPLESIKDLLAHREHFNAPLFWRIMASLWGQIDQPRMAKECGWRQREATRIENERKKA